MKYLLLAAVLMSQVAQANDILAFVENSLSVNPLTCVETYANGRRGGNFESSALSVRELFRKGVIQVESNVITSTVENEAEVSILKATFVDDQVTSIAITFDQKLDGTKRNLSRIDCQ